LAVVLFWLFTQVLGAMIGQSIRRTHFIQVLPSLFVLNALAVPLYLRWRAPPYAIRLAVLALGLWWGQVITDMPNRVVSLATAIWQSPDDAEWVQRPLPKVDVLQAAVSPDGCFWAWDNIGLVSYLAGRVACTPEHADHLMMVLEFFDYRRIRAEHLTGLFETHPQIHTRYEV
jgi:hypothetical protein